MNLAEIQVAVVGRIESATGLLPVKQYAKHFDHGGNPYVELIISPSETESETVDGGDLMSGIILLKVFTPDDHGSNYPAIEAQKFLDLFPRDLEFDGIRIPKTGTIRLPVDNEDAWWYTPATIQYEADACKL